MEVDFSGDVIDGLVTSLKLIEHRCLHSVTTFHSEDAFAELWHSVRTLFTLDCQSSNYILG